MFRKIDPSSMELTITIDGIPVPAEPGETVAAVLLRTAPGLARTTPVGEAPRTPYCMMGVCFDCLATIDGEESVQSCLVQVRDGMKVERQLGKRKIP